MATLINNTTGVSSSATTNPSLGVTVPSTTAGSFLIVGVTVRTAGNTPTVTVSDNVNAGNWTAMGDPIETQNNEWTQMFFKENSAAAVTLVTVSATIVTQTGAIAVAYGEISGISGGAIDAGLETGGTASAATTYSKASGAATNSGSIVFIALGSASATTWTANSPAALIGSAACSATGRICSVGFAWNNAGTTAGSSTTLAGTMGSTAWCWTIGGFHPQAVLTSAVADNAATSDTIAGATILARGLSEAAATADTLDVAAQHVHVAEACATADVASPPPGNLAELCATADTVSGHVVLSRALTEANAAADSISGHSVDARTLAETNTAVDTLIVRATSVDEHNAAVDSIGTHVVLSQSLSEACATADAVATAHDHVQTWLVASTSGTLPTAVTNPSLVLPVPATHVGDFLIVAFTIRTASAQPTGVTVTDNQGQSWSVFPMPQFQDGTGTACWNYCYYFPDTLAGVSTVTISATTTGSAGIAAVYGEVAGFTSGVADTGVENSGFNSIAGTFSVVSGNASDNGTLVFCALFSSGAPSTWTFTSPFVLIGEQLANPTGAVRECGIALGWNNVGTVAGSTETATGTLSPSKAYNFSFGGFRPTFVLAQPIFENCATDDTVAPLGPIFRGLAEGNAAADTIADARFAPRTAVDTALTADAALPPIRSLSENAATVDAVASYVTIDRALPEADVTVDSISGFFSRARSIPETASTMDSVVVRDTSVDDTALTADAITTGAINVSGADDESLTDDNLATGGVAHRSIADSNQANDFVVGLNTSGASVRAVTKVVATFGCSATFVPPAPVPGPSGLHDYEVIVCDKYGVAYGQIATAVPTQIDWELNQLGQALIDFWILDPSAYILPITCFPGAREIQVWRDQELIWWGWPISATFDAKQVHLSCSGLLWPFSTRNFGPITTNYLANPSFEQPAPTSGQVPAWDVVGITANVVGTVPAVGVALATTPLLGNFMTQLVQADAGVDTYLRQYVPVDSGAQGTFYDLSAWCYIDPNVVFDGVAYAPALDQNGLFIQFIADETVLAGPAVQQITADTGAGTWTRLETGVLVAPNQVGVLEIRLYAPQGVIYWDACQLTVEESVGSSTTGNDVQFICDQIVTYAQDPTRGKSDIAIPFNGPATNVDLIRIYQFFDNAGILDALNEFPTIGVCDFEVTWDRTGHYRTFQLFPPAKGAIKYNYPLEVDLGAITDLEGSVDGSQVATAVRFLGQGSTGSSEDIGYAAFPSLLGGRTSPDAQLIQGEVEVVSSLINFSSADVGVPIYCLTAGVIPIGTVISEVLSSSTAVMSKPAILSANPSTIGLDGITIDNVQSSLADQPIGTLQGSAEGYLLRQLQALLLPTSRQRADGPRGLFGNVTTGDVVPVNFTYGWLTIGPVLMRIATLTLYPPTEELEVQLNAIPLGSNSYG